MEKAQRCGLLVRSIIGSPDSVRKASARWLRNWSDELIVVSDVYEHSERLRSVD